MSRVNRVSSQSEVGLSLDPDTTNIKLVARGSELMIREHSLQRATRFILVVAGACVSAGSSDKSTDEQRRALLKFSRQPGVDLPLHPETTNVKLVAR